MSCVDLTDDELWRAIAENTNAMSAAIHQQMELGEKIGETDDPGRAHLIALDWRRSVDISVSIGTGRLSFAVAIGLAKRAASTSLRHQRRKS